ncbi:MAG: hypothetical protein LBU73_00695 [Helicobacteraceae bacterium]|nr:hypothetical protein [Helicobacteraceae bacterium]
MSDKENDETQYEIGTFCVFPRVNLRAFDPAALKPRDESRAYKPPFKIGDELEKAAPQIEILMSKKKDF